ncbi:ABC transporter permease [Falsibacillus albus]|uniref:ABC transporter permease n=1 Tax=Falsibacillus albus TaxID=2478915 RepID=A0A3L7K391_9BACI|nr:ABC transporter permease [Falsibacillus albus]RLQ97290.1 ABC transporter permease [Falsibacillus albus]
MKQINRLWRERSQTYNQEIRKYLRYMLNDHLLFVMIFAIGGGAYYYNNWIDTLDQNFPVSWVMAIILGIIVTISPIQTLLKEADQVFLLPLEHKMANYFRKGIWTSFFTQSYQLLIILAVLMPLYAGVTGEGFQSFFYLFIPLLILKVWNLYIQWFLLKFQEKEFNQLDKIGRLLMNVIFIFLWTAKSSYWLVAAVAVVYVILFIYYWNATKNKLLKWDTLIELEQQRMLLFYRVANLFTDVPKLKGEVRRRKWLDPLLKFVSYGHNSSFQYLFSRTFIRNSEYFGLFCRLTIIAAVFIYFSHNMFVIIGITLLFIYLTGFQMIPLFQKQDNKIWVHLYPVNHSLKKKSFLRLTQVLLLIQTFIFLVILMVKHEWMSGGASFIIGAVFSMFIVQLYIPMRLSKMEKY